MVLPVRQRHGPVDPPECPRSGHEQAVVRPDKEGPATRLGGELPPYRLVVRVYDRQINGVLGHVPGGVPQRLGPADHVELGDVVGHVDDGDTRRDANHHAPADPNQLTGEAVVGYKANWSHRHSIDGKGTSPPRRSGTPDPVVLYATWEPRSCRVEVECLPDSQ